MAQKLKDIGVLLVISLATFLGRLLIALVLLLTVTVLCLLIPFVGTRVAAICMVKSIDLLTEDPL